MSLFLPMDQTYWYLPKTRVQRLEHDLDVDVVIVGGGMAGLSAAQACIARGLKVALIEKTFCGSGATGKSSGFITPDAEFSFSDLVRMKDLQTAQKVWKFVTSGVDTIRATISQYSIECEYQERDTCMLATSRKSFKKLSHEHEVRSAHSLESKLYTKESIKDVVAGTGYFGGVSYGNTFSIKAFDYCQALKNILRKQGALIFEESPVTEILANGVKTESARVTARKIIVAVDHLLPQLAPFTYDVYHVQTFLMASAPLPTHVAQSIFPDRQMMAWDTNMIYNYFRLTPDNRLLLGGADLFSTYSSSASYGNTRIFKKLSRYAQTHFPQLSLQWEYMWPGLIGITKDLFPLAGLDKKKANIFYISGAAGLPWAAALGAYAVEALYDNRSDLDALFNPYRSFFIPHTVQALIGKKLSFALSNFKQVGSL